MAILSQKDKAVQFRQLHSGPNILVLPNAWDAASARVFEQAGFPAVATTSSGVAASLGYPDGQRISRDMPLSTSQVTIRMLCRRRYRNQSFHKLVPWLWGHTPSGSTPGY